MIFDFKVVTEWFDNLLNGFMPAWATTVVECVLIGVGLLVVYALLALFYIYFERKVCGAFQCRLGPNRVGPLGLLQSFADMFKILIKELIPLNNIDKFLFNLAPFLVIVASFAAFAVLPWGKGLQIIDFNIGIFFLTAVSSIGVLGILLAGLSIMTIVLLSGTMSVTGLVEGQKDLWFLFQGHIPAVIAFIVYMIAGTAETNRGPFDLPEAESELTAGYHTEYSGLHFGLFYLAEYLNLFIVSGVATLLFFGGWMPLHIPGWEGFNAVMDYIPSVVWFVAKAVALSFIIIWFKWTFPRLRIDQLLAFEWKYLLPINLFNLVLMLIVVAFGLSL